MPRTTCLTTDELAAIQLGDLPETQLADVGEHLERCARCEALARELDGRTDPMLEALRRSVTTASTLPCVEMIQRVGEYEIQRELGRGGMGIVYLARHLRLQRIVALKMLREGEFALPEERRRFLSEAAAIARLQHPHVVQIYEIGEHAGALGLTSPYFTLEYVEGGSLATVLASGPTAPREAAAWLEPLARAVHHAHRQGIIHRDIKPSNVLLTKDGEPKLCDFGIAKLLEGADGKTQTGMVVGTPEYLAPEQVEGTKDVGATADVHALGALLYAMLTGRPPYQSASRWDTLRMIIDREPVPPRLLQPKIPRDLDTICLRCLQKAPQRRYATAEALAEDLRRFLDGKPIVARPAGLARRLAKWSARQPAAAALIAVSLAALVVLLAAGTYYNWRLREAVAAKEEALAEAAERAREARERFDIALAAHNQLVMEVNELGKNPATRPQQKRLLESAIAGLQRVARSYETSAPDVGRAAAHQKLGSLFAQIGQDADARTQFEHVQRVAEGILRNEPANHRATECLCEAYCALGNLCLLRNEVQQGRKYYENAVAAADGWLGAAPGERDARRLLASSLNRFAHACLWDRDHSTAAKALARCESVIEQWRAAAPDDQGAVKELATTLDHLATVREQLGDLGASRDVLRRAVALSGELLRADPSNLAYKRGLYVALNNLAAICDRLDESAEMRGALRDASKIISEMAAADPENVQLRCDEALMLYNLAYVEGEAAEFANQAALLRDALECVRKLDAEGKIRDRPKVAVEMKEQVERDLAFVTLAMRVCAEPGVILEQTVQERPLLLRARLRRLAVTGQADEAVATIAALLEAEAAASGEGLYAHARLCAGCCRDLNRLASAALWTSTMRAALERLEEHALATLQRAVAAGFQDRQRVLGDRSWSTLRGRSELQEIVKAMRE